MYHENKQPTATENAFIKETREGFIKKHPKLLGTIAGIAAAGALAHPTVEAVHTVLAPEKSTEASQPKGDELRNPYDTKLPAGPETVDPYIDQRLVLLQSQFDGDNTIAPTDVPPAPYKIGGEYVFTIQKGDGIITDALGAYEDKHGLKGDDEVPATVIDSINITGKSFAERLEKEGNEGAAQPGVVLKVTELTDANGDYRAVVSNIIKDDTQ